MQATETLGGILKTERERRGLSLEEVHDATKIMLQNIIALEEDRFDSFPNKVYARAFLRDYANFLGLDSAALLTRYEDEWCAGREAPVSTPRGGPILKGLAYIFIALILLGGLSVGGYFGWKAIEKKSNAPKTVERPVGGAAGEGATLPRPMMDSETPKPKPEEKPKPEKKPAEQTAPQSVKLDVKATEQVWVQIWTDGKSAFIGEMSKGQMKTYEGKKSVQIKAGKAGAVQLMMNGQPQPSLGSLRVIGNKTFTLPAQPAQPDAGAAGAADSTNNTNSATNESPGSSSTTTRSETARPSNTSRGR